MNRFLKLAALFTCLLAVAPALNAQKPKEILTNQKIIELVRLGLGEAVVVEKIRQSTCQCDTSTAALARLKAAKVPDAVVMAMFDAASGETLAPPKDINNGGIERIEKPVAAKDFPGTSDAARALGQISEPGIYLFENGEMKQIEPSVFSGGKINPLVGIVTYGIKKTKYRAKVRGGSANMQTANVQPVFYFVFNPEYKNSGAVMAGNLFWGMPATSPAEFILVQMNAKDNSREAVLGEYGTWTGTSMGARDKDVREYAFEKLKSGVYKVVPKAGLAAGEYCFYYAGNVTGIGFAGGKIFDFGVASRR